MMTTIDFSISINAPREKVWDALWSEDGYKQWTAVFSEGSYAVTDWKEGSKIQFLSPGGNGMFGIIKKIVPLEQMVFVHEGEVKNGIEEIKDWSGATESYYLTESNGVTELKASMDATEEFKDYFSNTFPKALEKIKEISEQ